MKQHKVVLQDNELQFDYEKRTASEHLDDVDYCRLLEDDFCNRNIDCSPYIHETLKLDDEHDGLNAVKFDVHEVHTTESVLSANEHQTTIYKHREIAESVRFNNHDNCKVVSAQNGTKKFYRQLIDTSDINIDKIDDKLLLKIDDSIRKIVQLRIYDVRDIKKRVDIQSAYMFDKWFISKFHNAYHLVYAYLRFWSIVKPETRLDADYVETLFSTNVLDVHSESARHDKSTSLALYGVANYNVNDAAYRLDAAYKYVCNKYMLLGVSTNTYTQERLSAQTLVSLTSELTSPSIFQHAITHYATPLYAHPAFAISNVRSYKLKAHAAQFVEHRAKMRNIADKLVASISAAYKKWLIEIEDGSNEFSKPYFASNATSNATSMIDEYITIESDTLICKQTVLHHKIDASTREKILERQYKRTVKVHYYSINVLEVLLLNFKDYRELDEWSLRQMLRTSTLNKTTASEIKKMFKNRVSFIIYAINYLRKNAQAEQQLKEYWELYQTFGELEMHKLMQESMSLFFDDIVSGKQYKDCELLDEKLQTLMQTMWDSSIRKKIFHSLHVRNGDVEVRTTKFSRGKITEYRTPLFFSPSSCDKMLQQYKDDEKFFAEIKKYYVLFNNPTHLLSKHGLAPQRLGARYKWNASTPDEILVYLKHLIDSDIQTVMSDMTIHTIDVFDAFYTSRAYKKSMQYTNNNTPMSIQSLETWMLMPKLVSKRKIHTLSKYSKFDKVKWQDVFDTLLTIDDEDVKYAVTKYLEIEEATISTCMIDFESQYLRVVSTLYSHRHLHLLHVATTHEMFDIGIKHLIEEQSYSMYDAQDIKRMSTALEKLFDYRKTLYHTFNEAFIDKSEGSFDTKMQSIVEHVATMQEKDSELEAYLTQNTLQLQNNYMLTHDIDPDYLADYLKDVALQMPEAIPHIDDDARMIDAVNFATNFTDM